MFLPLLCVPCTVVSIKEVQIEKQSFSSPHFQESLYSSQTYLLMLNIEDSNIDHHSVFSPCLSCCHSSPCMHSLDMSQWEFGKFWLHLPPPWDFPHPLNVHGIQVLFSWFLSQKDLEISHVPSLLLAPKTNLSSSKAVIICTAVFVLLVSMDFLPEYVSVHCFVCVGSSLSRFYSCYMQGGLSHWIQIQHTQMWRNSSGFE